MDENRKRLLSRVSCHHGLPDKRSDHRVAPKANSTLNVEEPQKYSHILD